MTTGPAVRRQGRRRHVSRTSSPGAMLNALSLTPISARQNIDWPSSYRILPMAPRDLAFLQAEMINVKSGLRYPVMRPARWAILSQLPEPGSSTLTALTGVIRSLIRHGASYYFFDAYRGSATLRRPVSRSMPRFLDCPRGAEDDAGVSRINISCRLPSFAYADARRYRGVRFTERESRIYVGARHNARQTVRRNAKAYQRVFKRRLLHGGYRHCRLARAIYAISLMTTAAANAFALVAAEYSARLPRLAL